MKRDGSTISLWQTIEFVPQPFTLTKSYDVIIVGGGMTGVTTALMIQKTGKRCLLVESFNLGFGTTGGTTAHLNTLLDTPYSTIATDFGEETARIVADAAKGAIKLIEHNISVYKIQCDFKRVPGFLYAQDDKETTALEEIYKAGNNAGVVMDFISTLPITTSFTKVLKVEEQAKFHPMKYLVSLATEFEQLGGHILTDCMVEDAHEHQRMINVQTSRGLLYGNKIVYATHIPTGINLLHLRCAPWRSYAMAVKLKSENYPEGLIYDKKDPYHYYRTQMINDEAYLIAGGKDHKTGDVENESIQFTKLRAQIETIFPVKEIAYQWSSQYFEPADGLPYIGVLPGKSDSFYVATGFGGNGMIYAHVAAIELTNLITNKESHFDNVFSPSRIKPIAGFSGFVDHNKDVVKHFIGKYFGVEDLEVLAEIAPGEGKVVKIENAHVAVSKDIHGKIHAVSSACTHMKCDVTWNSAEHTWDCPCHGARYNMDGIILTGPASQNLEPIIFNELVKSN